MAGSHKSLLFLYGCNAELRKGRLKADFAVIRTKLQPHLHMFFFFRRTSSAIFSPCPLYSRFSFFRISALICACEHIKCSAKAELVSFSYNAPQGPMTRPSTRFDSRNAAWIRSMRSASVMFCVAQFHSAVKHLAAATGHSGALW